MKKLLLALPVCALMFSGTSLGIGAPSLDDLKGVVSNPKGGCAQGSLIKAKFTIRSLGGQLCSFKTVAAVSKLVCPSAVKDFTDSSCDKIGTTTLGGQDPADYLRAAASSETPDSSDATAKFAKGLYDNICTSNNADYADVKTRLKCPA